MFWENCNRIVAYVCQLEGVAEQSVIILGDNIEY